MIDKNTLDTSGFTLKPSPEVNARVREFLNAQLKAFGVDCESLYITTVHNVIDPTVTFSQDLLALGNDTLEWGTVQKHVQGLTGIFSKHWTFEDVHQVHKPGLYDVEKILQALLDDSMDNWNV